MLFSDKKLLCEDLNMAPLLAVTDGRGWLPAHGDVAALVQDALGEIEYSIGAADTKWGAGGHPAPFRVRYVEIGNEDFSDPRATCEARFPKLFDAIRAKYPQLKLIAARRDMHTRVPDLIDDHIYENPAAMARAGAKYGSCSRAAPKILAGDIPSRSTGHEKMARAVPNRTSAPARCARCRGHLRLSAR